MLPEYPFTLHDNLWSGGICITGSSEGKAALVFSEETELLFGMFCSYESDRVLQVESEEDFRKYYKGAPEEIREMADGLSMLFENETREGVECPIITTGFWKENGRIVSFDTRSDWHEHGGHLLDYRMMPFEKAMPYYEEVGSMDASRAKIAERIYRERIQSPDRKVVLTKSEIAVLKKIGEENIEVCKEVFESFGVGFEE